MSPPSSGDSNCEVCGEFHELLRTQFKDKLNVGLNDGIDLISKREIEVLYRYLSSWVQRQCLCVFREGSNVERFGTVIKCVIGVSVHLLKSLESVLSGGEEEWSSEETERLMQFMAKVFMLQFPLYSGVKQMGIRAEEISQGEATQLGVYCDHHDSSDFPVSLLRNVSLFCKSGGLQGMANAFKLPPSLLSPSLAHSLISILCNVKLWLNYRAVLQLFTPVRSNALNYMCQLEDGDLRQHSARHMSDFLWSCVKENLDSPISFDKDGLELAFKYFSSSTLTMRLAGIAQINSHVNLFNEMCNTESVVEVENVGLQLAAWVLQNGILEHIFGPNLHVEIIKQSHILLNFLAVEGKITNHHIDVVWQAAQLKHCSKQVHDLLLPLIKNLEAGPVLHLYELLKNLPIKDHTEQTIHLAQVLQKFIWTSGGTFSHLIQEASSFQKSVRKNDLQIPSFGDEDEENSKAPKSNDKVNNKAANVGDHSEPVITEAVDKKSVNSSDCDFGIDDLDEDDLNEYSEDDEEEEDDDEDDEEEEDEEEEEDDDDEEEDDEEIPSTDDDTQRRHRILKRKSHPPSTLTSDKTDDKKIAKENKSGFESRERKESPTKIEQSKDIPELIPIMKNSKTSPTIEPEKPDDSNSQGKGTKRGRLQQNYSSDSDVGEDTKCNSPLEEGKKKLKLSEEKSSSPLNLVAGKAGVPPWWTNAANNAIRLSSGSAMTELANLVNAHPTGPAFSLRSPDVHDMRPFLRNLASQREVAMEEGLSGDNDSVSSRLSNKSDKNLADFEDENSVDEEVLQLAQSQDLSAILQQQHQLASLYQQHRLSSATSRLTARQQKEETRVMSHYKLESACEPGNTLLWDLLQDGNIENLAEGLATEAEKALTSLLCFNMERFIRMKFVEGCLNNVAKNRSVVISLRLLPKLFQSFQHFRGMDTHEVSMYAERKFGMTKLFFNNLQVYFKRYNQGHDEDPFFNHLAQVQVRLQFLGVLFSIQVSPTDFRLSNEQIHILWECLASDTLTSDDLFQWLLIQAHSKEQHAIGLDGFKLIYNEKIPLIKPETISMLGLNLFSQLCQLSRITKQNSNDNNVKMDQLWKIALCAQNTDVSMKAIQILNTAYFGQGEEFLITCMKSLKAASNDLDNGKDEILIRIQRALLLLKTYLETFRRKYAYHFRRLSIDGQGVSTHAELVELRTIGSIRVVVQAAGFQDKVTFEMQAMDLVADLRAEICAWWEGKASREKQTASPLLGSMLNEGPLRLITQGQEISSDTDEKSLIEMGFKDLQMVFVSQGATSNRNGQGTGLTVNRGTNMDIPSFPGRDKMPMNLLLMPVHFEQLFSLMQNLSSLRLKNEKDDVIPHTKAQILSRRVWDILMLLPTNPQIKDKLLNIGERTEDEIQSLLSPEFPQKLMYTFYIVDWLGRPARLRRHSGVVESAPCDETSILPGGGGNVWINKFISSGGLKHLFDIFTSGILQYEESTRIWCEWKQDCLSALIKLLVQFGVNSEDYEALADQIIDESPPKKKMRGKRKNSGGGPDRLLVPRLSKTMLDLMNVEVVMPRITSVLLEVSRVKDPNQYRTGVFGRAQVVHFCVSLLVAWIYSVADVEDALLSSNGLPAWLRHLVLEDYDPAVRREMCTGLYKLCMGSTTSGKTGVSVTGPMLSILLEFLDDALLMKPVKRENHAVDDGKEPYGPACRDYFWILCRLIDIMRVADNDSSGLVDLDQLSRQLACGLVARKFYEKRHGDPSPDDALVGTLNLLCAVMKHQPPFKTSPEGREFILHLLECLFALPTPREKDRPKCKSNASRTACYDLLVEMSKGSLPNYLSLHEKLMSQHEASAHKPYQWEYWPRDDGRAECGYVGLTNLGATCYMATCVQQLYMIPEARSAILRADLNSNGKHSNTLYELQRMFAYLRDSERKAYNPLSFCKTYQMDHQPLNTGEQKDMAEFFIDLLSKIEEMTPEMKHVIKDLFCGTLTNNVVSLDCNHVSKTREEFYTVRCQVSELRNLHQSLEEVTVKDTLEGDNMYTCSQCGKKVRAEKRACFKKLPKILAFNTMRYTFNMVTMLKEKVNTHFSFPFCLDMSPYMEHNLIPGKNEGDEHEEKNEGGYEYEIIGVTVHTGTADGGHYYAFIRSSHKDKWYSFNDAEVKPFDQNQIASECFGGEMNSRTYDQVTDKFMDLSIEKTNSAYMLFYERVEPSSSTSQAGPSTSPPENVESPLVKNIDLSQSLEEWIWQDNMNFIQDNNIFDHTYFNFMWQMVGSIPTTINTQRANEDITLLSGKLATSFFLESFIHAKEKLNIVQWVELLTKQFDSSTAACSWFLDHMARDNHWLVTIFLKCQVQTIRQMFHRLCIHVIQKLRPMEKDLYILPWSPKESDECHPDEESRSHIGESSPITRFIRMCLRLLESGSARPYLKHLTELFRFLYDFAKLGEEETKFLLSVNTITIYADFYLKAIKQNHENITVDVISDDDDDDDDIIALTPIAAESSKMASLDKMVCLIALLVEKSRGDDNLIHLSESDMNALTGGKSLVFLFNITKDNINTCQTCNLIFSLTRNNQELAEQVAGMVFAGVKQADFSMHFFRLLTLLTELSGGPSGMPCFTNLVMHKVWELAKTCPQAALDWLSIQVTRNRYVQSWLVSTLENWVEQYLIAHPNQKVRNSASFLVVSLVPSTHFRQAFRTARSSSVILNQDETDVLHQVIEFLFGLLPKARHYVDLQQHGSAKLVAYFQTMSHFLLSRTEKLMFEPHFLNLWQLFHPKLSEPSIPIHHNKQALLNFWYNLCIDCSENVRMILQNSNVIKNIAFNYILADHEDTEVINFNRIMLPTYYGLLRLCCMQSRTFTRQLAQHQNVHWAFKNITPYTTQYTVACDELFKLMALFVQKFPLEEDEDRNEEEEEEEIRSFRHQTLQLYLSILDGRSSWSTLINALKILIESNDDRIFVVYNNGLALVFDAFNMLHMMFHEATACHVTGELVELLTIFLELVKAVRCQRNNGEIRQILSRWKDMSEMTGRMLTLCNSFTPPELRDVCLSGIKEMLLLWPSEMLNILVPMLHRSHTNSTETDSLGLGPYFPRKGSSLPSASSLKTVRPPRPMLQMAVPASQLEAHHGQDPEYDRALQQYFAQYHATVDLMVRVSVNENNLTKMLVDLSAMVGLDGVPLHMQLFPKLWTDIHNTQLIDRKFILMLISSHGFLEYVDAVLLDERSSLNNPHIFNFLLLFFPKVSSQVLTDQVQSIISQLVSNFIDIAGTFVLDRVNPVKHLNGDLRALFLVSSSRPDHFSDELVKALKVLNLCVKKNLDPVKDETEDNPDDENGERDNDDVKDEMEASTSEVCCSISTDIDDAKKIDVVSSDEQRKNSSNSKLQDALAALSRTLMLLIQMCEKNLNEEKCEKEDGGVEEQKESPVSDSKSKVEDENEKPA